MGSLVKLSRVCSSYSAVGIWKLYTDSCWVFSIDAIKMVLYKVKQNVGLWTKNILRTNFLIPRNHIKLYHKHVWNVPIKWILFGYNWNNNLSKMLWFWIIKLNLSFGHYSIRIIHSVCFTFMASVGFVVGLFNIFFLCEKCFESPNKWPAGKCVPSKWFAFWIDVAKQSTRLCHLPC